MELFHALNRGVDKRDIFMDVQDHLRFIHDLYAFNDTSPSDTNHGYWFRTKRTSTDVVGPYFKQDRNRERLVDIHGWCLMKNHYHLLLSERIEGGLSLFLKKLNAGYAKYFNEKYDRCGTLFQGRTKRVLISSDAQFNYILHYIHLNALDDLKGAEKWRVRDKGGIRNTSEAFEHLERFRWSSYLDYAGKKNFPSILATSVFNHATGEYRRDLLDYLKDAEIPDPSVTLE